MILSLYLLDLASLSESPVLPNPSLMLTFVYSVLQKPTFGLFFPLPITAVDLTDPSIMTLVHSQHRVRHPQQGRLTASWQAPGFV